MGMLENLDNELKNAIKNKDSLKLDSLRAIKSAFFSPNSKEFQWIS